MTERDLRVPTSGRIVVGVNVSQRSAAALRWAAAEARMRRSDLVAVYGWQVASEPPPAEHNSGGAAPLRAYREAVKSRIEEFVADVVGVEGARQVVVDTPHRTPVRALLGAARRADLLVLGSPGRGRVAAAVLGSVTEQCVHHAPCPVVVVPVSLADTMAAPRPAAP